MRKDVVNVSRVVCGFSLLKNKKKIFNRFHGKQTAFRTLGSVRLVVGVWGGGVSDIL